MLHTELSADRLRELLDYDPATGAFTWRVFVKGARGTSGSYLTSHLTVDGPW